MTRRLALALIGVLLCAGGAEADPFQFIVDKTAAIAAYAQVRVDGQFIGYTDMYGRINIRAKDSGVQTCTVSFLGHEYTQRLTISGQTKVTTIRLK